MNQHIDYWLSFYEGRIPTEKVILDFLCKNCSLQTLEESSIPYGQKLNISRSLLEALLRSPLKALPILLHKAGCIECVSPANIPQYSNFASALIYLPKLLNDNMESMTNKEVGYALHQDCSNDIAAKKYGENHAKLAIACGLATATEKEGYAAVQISLLGSAYCEFDSEDKLNILQRLCYRIPVIQKAVVSGNAIDSIEESLLLLSESTRKRRRHNVYELLSFALDE